MISSTSQTENGSTPVKYKIKKMNPYHSVPNFILYKTVRIKVRDYLAQMT